MYSRYRRLLEKPSPSTELASWRRTNTDWTDGDAKWDEDDGLVQLRRSQVQEDMR